MSNGDKSPNPTRAAFGGCLVVAVLIVTVVWTSNSCGGPSATSSSAPAPVAFVDGSTGQIGKGGAGQPCFASKDDLNAFIDAETKGDKYGAGQALIGAINLYRGEHVRAIAHAGLLWSEVEIRIESGDDAGQACWIEADLSGLFVNIRSNE